MTMEELLATAQRQGIELWLEGEQLFCNVDCSVSEEMIARLRERKGEIIRILQGATATTNGVPELPSWCSGDCQYFDLAELPGGQQASIPGCFREDGAGGWVWSRLDKMNGCPIIRLQLPRLPAWCSRQCPYYHANLSGAQLVERCHWQDKTGRHWVRLRIEQLRRCPAKTEKSNRIKN